MFPQLFSSQSLTNHTVLCFVTVIQVQLWNPEIGIKYEEGLFLGVVHSVNRDILFLDRKPLSFSSKNRHRPTGRTIILKIDLLTARSKFFAIS